MSSDTHVRARTALQGRMQRVRTCTDRSRVRARVLSRCEDNGADAARSRATCDGTVCCASPRGADGGGSAVGAPAPSQATQWRRCAIRVDSRRSASSRFPRGGAPLVALVHRCDAAVVSRAATPRHCRLPPGCLYASPAACVPRASSSRRADAGVSAPQASVRGGEDDGPAAWATRGSTPALCSSSCVLVNPRK